MKKLIRGIIEFRKNFLLDYRKKFAKLHLGQSPDSLFIACSDSRVVPNVFASTDPGDLFVLRNIGNLIVPCQGHKTCDESIAATIEFSLEKLNISDIIICGHSECAAMQAVVTGLQKIDSSSLSSWLRHAEPAYTKLKSGFRMDQTLSLHNELSQINVLQQLEHLKTYPLVEQALANQKLRIHGWWFDLKTANVYFYKESLHQFVLIDENLD